MTEPKPCPFCGAAPLVGPKNPERDGDGWAFVVCKNPACHVKPQCADYDLPDEGPETAEWHRENAARKWNIRVQ